ncbi:hypothetical protein [Paenibacillus sp. SYP-B4298]|uniref:hypothetical protein n=1 Tax=Paenibacillus sp. SYP-B4298 TaxID=2996034 RepID=UPI0022DE29A8|nr:hypothetical protein [Paenibacillus sp. SYP-B4298]
MKQEWYEGEKTYYFELDTEGTVMRQIIKQRDHLFASNRPNFCLSETTIEFEPYLSIQCTEFDEAWTKANVPFMNDWLETIKSIKDDTEVEGYIEVIYPQGIIINLGNGKYGITDYEECKRVSDSSNIYTGNRIKGKISGIDNINLWVILKETKVI